MVHIRASRYPFFALAVMLVSIGTHAADITTGLVAYYKMDEGGSTFAKDSSGNNGTGEIIGTNVWAPIAPVGGGLIFDSVNTWVDCRANMAANGLTSVTLAAWVNTSATGTTDYRGVITKQGAYGMYIRQGLLTVYDFASGVERPSNIAVSPGVWHHVATTQTAGSLIYYLDGVQVATQPLTALPAGGLLTLGAGTNSNHSATATAVYQLFSGTMDEARVYNRILSATDIAALYNYHEAPMLRTAFATTAAQVDLLFSSNLEAASANNPANYSINDGVTVTGAALQADQRSVRLTTSLQPRVYYTLSIINVKNIFNETMSPAQASLFVGITTFNTHLTAKYDFEETAGPAALDSSGNGYAGFYRNGASPTTAAGKNGAATPRGLALDGLNDYVDTGTSHPFHYYGGDMTVSLWCNITAGDDDSRLYSKATHGNGNYNIILFRFADGRVVFALKGSNLPGSYVEIISPVGSLPTGGWHHVAAVLDSAKNMRIFIDGVQRASGSHAGIVNWVPYYSQYIDPVTFFNYPADGYLPAAIGTLYPYGEGWAGLTGFSAQGSIDDVRVYSRTLSAGEISTLFRDRPAVSVAVADSSASEPGANTARFTISRTGSTLAALTVPITLTGTAAGADYALTYASSGLPAASPLTIPAGAASVDLIVTPVDDSAGESIETVTLTVNFSLFVYDRVAPTSATVSIADDEAIIAVLALPDASERGPQSGQFLLTRTNNTTGALTVNFTLTGTATNGTDFQLVSTTVNFLVGQSSVAISIDPFADALIEGPETAILSLTVAPGYYSPPGLETATVTIADCSIVTVQSSDPDAYEVGVNPGVFTLTRTGPFDVALTVPYTITGTAVAGVDYVALSGTVTFTVGQNTATVSVTPIDDDVLRADTIVTITLNGNLDFAVGTPGAASVTIHTDPEIFSGGSGGITITPNPALAGQTITYTGSGGGAAVVSWLWAYGDGVTATGQQTTHAYTYPGEYEVTASATLADGTVSVGRKMLFVGTAVDSSIPGATAVPPSGGGLLVGGGGILKLAGGKLKIRFSRRQVLLSAKLGNLMFEETMGQSSLQGRQGWLMIGPEANRRTYFFVLDGKGKGHGSNSDVPKIQVNLKKRSVAFTVVEAGLTEFLATLGASRTAPAAVVNVPITIRVADKVFLAFTLVLDFKTRKDNGSGTLRKR